jgi:hypothetical protein
VIEQNNLTAGQKDHSNIEIRGLICIDLWEVPPDGVRYPAEYYDWINLLPNKLSQFKFDSVINASYHTKIDYNDPSIYNTLMSYNWHEYDEEIMLELIKNCNNYKMSSVIQQHVLGANSFALYSIESFLKHINKLTPHIKDWLVIGNTWGICTHGRSIGLKNFSKIKNLNFYSTDWGFIKKDNQHCTKDDFKKDNLKWINIDNHLYKLKYDPR